MSTACAVAVLGVCGSLGASMAQAELFGGKNLPGHSWTTDGNVVGLYYERGEANTTSSVCVGPVTHNNEGYHFPYGWSCESGGISEWKFAEISAAAGIYNPNSGTFGEWSVLDY